MSVNENNKNKEEEVLQLPLKEEIKVECFEGVLDINADFNEYLVDERARYQKLKERNRSLVYGYDDYGDMTELEREEYMAWWQNFLDKMDDIRDGEISDDDYYDEYGNFIPNYRSIIEEPLTEEEEEALDDLPFSVAEEVWPSKSKTRKNPFNSNVNFKPQRFINGMEIDEDDDEFFDAFGGKRSKKHNRRKNKSHAKVYRHDKRKVKDTDIDEANRLLYNIPQADEEKTIIFYRTLADEDDCYSWNNLLEFNEWLQENGVFIKDDDVTFMLNNSDIHCCLDPTTSDKMLVVDRSYGDLVWNLTGADEDLIKDYSQRLKRYFI